MTARRGNVLLIILVAIGVVAASVGGYFWWSSYVKTPADKQSQLTWEECIKIPEAKQLLIYPGQCITPDGRKVTQPLSEEEKKNPQPPDETANWKTYRNSLLGYEMKYPNNWVPSRGPFNDSDEDLSRLYRVNFYDPIAGNEGSKGSLYVDVVGSTNQCSTVNECLKKFHYQMGFVTVDFNLTYVNFANSDALRSDREDKFVHSNLPNTRSDLFALINGSFYNIQLASGGKITPEKIKLFDQILSTFKFLD